MWGDSPLPDPLPVAHGSAVLPVLPGTISSPGASVHAAHQLAGLGVDAGEWLLRRTRARANLGAVLREESTVEPRVEHRPRRGVAHKLLFDGRDAGIRGGPRRGALRAT